MFNNRLKMSMDSLRQKPAQYLTSFLILHELTAILPLPMVYYSLKSINYTPNFPDKFKTDFGIKLKQNTELKVRKMSEYFGIDIEAQDIGLCVASYLVVKLLLPARIGLSLWLTPVGARIIDKLNPTILFKR